jgi:energy-coupling factor transport system substrate-specific component
MPYMFFREAYSAQLLAYYSEADVAAMVIQYTEPQWILLMCAMFVIGTVVGGLIGSKLLKRHVRKAKIA